jgi:hypothetical protein
MSYRNPLHGLDHRGEQAGPGGSKTIRQMTAEIREVNIEKGWRSAEGGPGGNTWGDYVALLHSEISEALEAYRDHRLADATRYGSAVHESQYPRIKPEGVGSEFADVLIRLLDMHDAFGRHVFEANLQIGDVVPMKIPDHRQTFGDRITWLHGKANDMAGTSAPALAAARMLRALVAVAEAYGIDLAAEYERKIAYNRTRPYQHGGRTIADGATA